MDEFKRKYSNEDTLKVALPHFWEHFDKDGWSIWYAEYRFPEELAQTFMSCNLITANTGSPAATLKGLWESHSIYSAITSWGHERNDTRLSPDWQVDYESYTWRKLEPESEECKTLVKEYFAWEGDFKHVGKAFNQGKVFK
ncbi:hypothetical protein E2320_013763 [Naja naja]|nr:hypothetical protein E2320_013763 [Naja naja]